MSRSRLFPASHRAMLLCLAFLFVVVGGHRPSAGSLAPNPAGVRTSSAFDSGLWTAIYRPDSTDPSDSQDGLDQATAKVPQVTQQRQEQSRLSQGMAQQLQEASLANVMAEEQQQEDQAEESGTVSTHFSDWQLSRIAAQKDRSLVQRRAKANGPTATTILVGLVAMIVVWGSVLSGRSE